MYQYIGQAIDSFLADLKPVQVKELKEVFEEMDKDGRGRGSLKPERLTRALAREAEAAEAAGVVDDGDAAPAEGASPTQVLERWLTKRHNQKVLWIRGRSLRRLT